MLLTSLRPFRHHRFFTTAVANARKKEEATMKWFRTIVVGEKLCPFAAPLLKQNNLLRIVSSSAQTVKEAVIDVREQVTKLVGKDRPETHETTLIVFDDHCDSFVYSYLDFIRLSWALQEEAIGDEYRDSLQLVLFHPRATHQTYSSTLFPGDGEIEERPGDYTIRSPYPTIHLLREHDVLKAAQSSYPDLEYLPSRNKVKLSEQGLDVCRERLRACFDVVNQ